MPKHRAALVLLLVIGLALASGPRITAGTGSVSIELQWNNAGKDPGQLYVSLAYASAREYYGFSAFQSCAGYYGRPTELITALYFSAESGRSPATILKQKKGKGWGRAAKEMGLPANYWAKGHGSGKKYKVEYRGDAELELDIYLRYLTSYYGADHRQLMFWMGRGLTQGDLLLGLNLAARTGRPVAGIMDLRARGTSWSIIAVRYRVGPAALTQPVEPRRSRYGG